MTGPRRLAGSVRGRSILRPGHMRPQSNATPGGAQDTPLPPRCPLQGKIKAIRAQCGTHPFPRAAPLSRGTKASVSYAGPFPSAAAFLGDQGGLGASLDRRDRSRAIRPCDCHASLRAIPGRTGPAALRRKRMGRDRSILRPGRFPRSARHTGRCACPVPSPFRQPCPGAKAFREHGSTRDFPLPRLAQGNQGIRSAPRDRRGRHGAIPQGGSHASLRAMHGRTGPRDRTPSPCHK